MSDAEQSNDPPQQPPADSPRRASAPGAVQAAAILLCVGGGLTVVFALAGLGSGALLRRSAAYALYGFLWLGLGYAVHCGRRWARRAVLVLCTVGAALAGIRLVASGVSEGISALAWPLVYAILLSTTPARAWFHRDRPAA